MKIRSAKRPTAKQKRMLTYARQAEQAFGRTLRELYGDDRHGRCGLDDLPRLGFECFKWLAALRGADPAMLDEVRAATADDLGALNDVLERTGSDEWYPRPDPKTGKYDTGNIRSTDWLIDRVVYRLYGLTNEEVRTVEGT